MQTGQLKLLRQEGETERNPIKIEKSLLQKKQARLRKTAGSRKEEKEGSF
jgi:hypothetical protein